MTCRSDSGIQEIPRILVGQHLGTWVLHAVK